MRRLQRILALGLSAAMITSAAPAYAISTQRVEAISFYDATHGFMAGGASPNGFVSYTDDGGLSWSAQRVTNQWLFGVAASSPTSAWAMSDLDDHVYRVGFAPASATPMGPVLNSLDTNLGDVAVLAGGRVVAVGQRKRSSSDEKAIIASSNNDGASWTTQFEGPIYPPPNDETPAPTTLAKLVAIDTTGTGMVAWAVGNERTPGTGGSGTPPTYKRPLFYRTTDGGSTWTTQTVLPDIGYPTGTPADTQFSFMGVAAASDQVAYAVGTFNWVAKTTDGGVTWAKTATRPLPTKLEGPFSYYAVSSIDESSVVAVGGAGRYAFTKDGGVTWTAGTVPGLATDLRGVSALDENTWIAVGDNEVRARTTNGGTTWTLESSQAVVPSVAISNPSAGWPLTTSPLVISGTASDVGAGVASVAVRIKRADNLYFNGSGWAAGESWLPAQSTDGWKHWSYDFTADALTVQGGAVTITARATDGLGLMKDVPVSSTDSRQSTTIVLTSKSAVLSYGYSGTVAGTLKAGTTAVPGAQVVLETSTNGTTFAASTTATTSGSGTFSVSVKPSVRTYYRVRFLGADGYKAAGPTAAVNLDPKAYLTTPSGPTTAYRNRAFSSGGYLRPRHTAGTWPVRIQCYRYESGRWVLRKTVSAKASDYVTVSSTFTRYTGSVSLPYTGKWRIRAWHDDTAHAATVTGYRYITVR